MSALAATDERTTPVIEVDDVSFGFGSALVLEQVQLSVGAGEFLGLVGPNAGGKSTLLRLILGLLEPQHGRVRVLGRPPRQVRRRIGYVPQYPPFPRDFPITVEQVVLMGRMGISPWLGPGAARTDRRRGRHCAMWRPATWPSARSAPSPAGSCSASCWRGRWWGSPSC